jgi:phosphate transport system protein
MGALQPLDEELALLQQSVLEMFARSESMVRLAIRSVQQRDSPLGRSVVQSDKELDQLELSIDKRCMELLAEHHPEGKRLRALVTVLKMVTDLERIGDLAVNIAERGLELSARSGLEPPSQLAEMGELVAEMLRISAEAFSGQDKDALKALKKKDKLVDLLNREVFENGLLAMEYHSDQVDRALSLTSISKYLERIGDHTVNLGQLVVFMVQGKDLRHG